MHACAQYSTCLRYTDLDYALLEHLAGIQDLTSITLGYDARCQFGYGDAAESAGEESNNDISMVADAQSTGA